MATWGQILGEIRLAIQRGDAQAYDTVRTGYIKALSDYTQRDTIIYASRWTSGDMPPNLYFTRHGFVHRIENRKLV